MPDTIAALAHGEHYRVPSQIVSQGHGIVHVSAKPWLAQIEPSAHLAAVIIQDNLSSIDPARQPGPGNFHLRRFVARHPRPRSRSPTAELN